MWSQGLWWRLFTTRSITPSYRPKVKFSRCFALGINVGKHLLRLQLRADGVPRTPVWQPGWNFGMPRPIRLNPPPTPAPTAQDWPPR